MLIDPVVNGLQDELADLHRMSAVGLRMRVSIGVGPLTDSDEPRLGNGSGATMVETHRLLDSEPLRSALLSSDPEVTFVAVMISHRVFEDVVAAGYTIKATSEFCRFPVQVKNYRSTGYLHVPRPSGHILTARPCHQTGVCLGGPHA
jgi:hypothetical protein